MQEIRHAVDKRKDIQRTWPTFALSSSSVHGAAVVDASNSAIVTDRSVYSYTTQLPLC
jgi:hypothetical protein